jgi:hypothetical protein
MFSKTRIALSLAMVLGAASAALANDRNDVQQDERGGYAGSTHGNTFGNAGVAYGYAVAPGQWHRPSRGQIRH